MKGPSRTGKVFDLTIVGGGPTGLLTALLARQLGLSVQVLDAKTGPLKLGRADAMNARTQQYMEVAGVIDELLPQGITCNTSSTFTAGEFASRQSHWWTSLAYCHRKNFLMLGQPAIEACISSHLTTESDSESVVRYGTSVVGIKVSEETNTPVEVTTSAGDVVSSWYLVAADGARSTVRNALSVPFTGTKPEMVWAVLDTFITTSFPVCNEIITFQLNGESRVSWIPRERGMARFYVLLDGKITEERVKDSIRQHMAPHTISFDRIEWFSTFDVKERIAGTFRPHPRVFLAGDAAHVHSVNGGQGLNTGVADAFALTWRLALSIRDSQGQKQLLQPGAAEEILTSYATERHIVAADIINIAATLVRDTVHTAKQYVRTIERNAGYITGMGVAYNDECCAPSLVQTQTNLGIWQSGFRCPDILLCNLAVVGQNKYSLYSIVSYGKFLIVSLGAQWRINKDDRWGKRKDFVQFLSIIPAKAQLQCQTDKADFLVSEEVEVGEEGVVIVRPDMYVCYAGKGYGGWSEYLDTIFA